MRVRPFLSTRLYAAVVGLAVASASASAKADGFTVPPRYYHVPIWETTQNAIIIHDASTTTKMATEDMILQLQVESQDALSWFGWVVPLPTAPETVREDPTIFREVANLISERTTAERGASAATSKGSASTTAHGDPRVRTLSRETVGKYDVTIVRAGDPGALNRWLDREGLRSFDRSARKVIDFYQKKGYVFACIKVTEVQLSRGQPVDLHPLRFTFATGGEDAVYFPMRMTGLQSQPFDVNLFVFHASQLNERQNRFGYAHRGMDLVHRLVRREGSSAGGRPPGGPLWADPKSDPALREDAAALPALTSLFGRLHPEKRYHLTSVSGRGFDPAEVKDWADDLWVFPEYADPEFVPIDARPGGAAEWAWANTSEGDPARNKGPAPKHVGVPGPPSPGKAAGGDG